MTTTPATVKANQALWEKGAFTRIAATMRRSARELVTDIGIGPGAFLEQFRTFYGPTMNAYAAAAATHREAELHTELADLFRTQNIQAD